MVTELKRELNLRKLGIPGEPSSPKIVTIIDFFNTKLSNLVEYQIPDKKKRVHWGPDVNTVYFEYHKYRRTLCINSQLFYGFFVDFLNLRVDDMYDIVKWWLSDKTGIPITEFEKVYFIHYPHIHGL